MKVHVIFALVFYASISLSHESKRQIFLCDFDDYDNEDNWCGGTSASGSGQLSRSQFNDLPSKPSVKITDFTSLTRLEGVNSRCDIPFKKDGEDQYFCVFNSGVYECQTLEGNFANCDAGSFLRVKSPRTPIGAAFSHSFTFNSPLDVKVGTTYTVSMFTLVNCGLVAECDKAGDTISVKIKEGDDGEFNEVYKVSGRSFDIRWIQDAFSVEAQNEKLYIRLDFTRSTQSNGEALLLVDQLQVVEEMDSEETTEEEPGTTIDLLPTTTHGLETTTIAIHEDSSTAGMTTTTTVAETSTTPVEMTTTAHAVTSTTTPVDGLSTETPALTTTPKETTPETPAATTTTPDIGVSEDTTTVPMLSQETTTVPMLSQDTTTVPMLSQETTTVPVLSQETTTIPVPTSPPIGLTKSLLCNFDDFTAEDTSACGKITLTQSGDASISALQLDNLPDKKKITDYTSILGKTVGQKTCNIPFQFSNEPSYFCALNEGKFVCQVKEDDTLDECNLGRFIRVKSNLAGSPFKATYEYANAVGTQPGRYGLSMFTLINCGQVGFGDAQDSISVQIKDGVDGDFVEVYNVNGRSNDDRWKQDSVFFDVKNTHLFIRLDFERKNANSGVANIYVDQLEIYGDVDLSAILPTPPTTTPAVTTTTEPIITTTAELASDDLVFCDFDDFETGSLGVCGGVAYTATAGAVQLSGLQLDSIPSALSKSITDYTSIQGKTESEKTCSIPFTFLNEESYFCVLDTGKYVCQTNDNSIDKCKLGKFMRFKTNRLGQPFTANLEFKKAFITKPGSTYSVRLYALINCGRDGCVDARDSLAIHVKDGANGQFNEIYNINNRSLDDRWYAYVANFKAQTDRAYIRLEASRAVANDSVANIFFDQLEVFQAVDLITTTSTVPSSSPSSSSSSAPSTSPTLTSTTPRTVSQAATTTKATASNLPAILGGSIGGAAGLVIIIVIVFFVVKKCKSTSKVEAIDDDYDHRAEESV